MALICHPSDNDPLQGPSMKCFRDLSPLISTTPLSNRGFVQSTDETVEVGKKVTCPTQLFVLADRMGTQVSRLQSLHQFLEELAMAHSGQTLQDASIPGPRSIQQTRDRV